MENLTRNVLSMCRTCLNDITSDSKSFDLNYLRPPDKIHTIQQELLNIIPEMKLDQTPDALICSDCSFLIESFYNFKEICIQNQDYYIFSNNRHETSNTMSLQPTSATVKIEPIDVNLLSRIKEEPLNTSESLENQCFEEIVPKAEPQLEIVDINSVLFNTDLNNFIIKEDVLHQQTTKCFKCLHCDYRTSFKSLLTVHSRIHTRFKFTKKLLRCKQCMYYTFYKSNLISHKTKHLIQSEILNNESYKPAYLDTNLYNRNISIYNSQNNSASNNFSYTEVFILFRCSICGLNCNSHSQLNNHMKSSHLHNMSTDKQHYQVFVHNGVATNDPKDVQIKTEEFTCEMCGFRTKFDFALMAHMKCHSKNGQYNCPKCDYFTKRKKTIILHMRRHSGDKPYKCRLCNYFGVSKDVVQQHAKVHSDIKPYQCDLCDFSTKYRNTFKSHKANHTGVKKYKCYHCEYSTVFRSTLVAHVQVHRQDKSFKCNLCNYCTITKLRLKNHMKTHVKEKPFKCSKCDYACRDSLYLKVHMNTHSEDKLYECSICGAARKSRLTLASHMKTHIQEKKYACTECGYKARYRSNLTTHMRIHAEETPYKCNICSMYVTTNASLIRHMKIHTGVKAFKCTLCNYEAFQETSLQQHLKTQHKEGL